MSSKKHPPSDRKLRSAPTEMPETASNTEEIPISSAASLQVATPMATGSNPPTSYRKLRSEPTEMPETASSPDDQNPRASKAHKVSPNASASTVASLLVDLKATTTIATSSTAAKQERSIVQIIKDVFHYDIAKASAALDALNPDFMQDKKKCDSLVKNGGCVALVMLLEKCLDKAIDSISVCDQVTELNELAELTTLHKTLLTMMHLTFQLEESKVRIAASGGVEAVVKVLKTFPKCQALQEFACTIVFKMTSCSVGNKIVVETGGIEVCLAAINNHLNSDEVCKYACFALSDMMEKANKEDIILLISLGGATAVAKVREEWQDEENIVEAWVKLGNLIGTEMASWTDLKKAATANTASVADAADTTAGADAKQEESIESIGQMIQELAHTDIAKVDAALDALNLDLKDDKKKGFKIQIIVGGLALVQLLKKCLDKAIDSIPVCDQVTELNELAELTALHKTLLTMIHLTNHLDYSKAGIAAIGGVEAVVKVLKTFPKCQALQEFACTLVFNLACCSVGNKRVVETGGIEVCLAAINNHLNSADVCKYACMALSAMIETENKEDIRLLISLGGATAVAKVRSKWPDGDAVQAWVKLGKLIGTEMVSWTGLA
jgi:hypothetical protein